MNPSHFILALTTAQTPERSARSPVSQQASAGEAQPEKGLACPVPQGYHPEQDGVYRVGRGVSVPRLTKSVKPNFTPEARRQITLKGQIHVATLVMLTIGTDGKTRDLCVLRGAGYGLDSEALKAAGKYAIARR